MARKPLLLLPGRQAKTNRRSGASITPPLLLFHSSTIFSPRTRRGLEVLVGLNEGEVKKNPLNFSYVRRCVLVDLVYVLKEAICEWFGMAPIKENLSLSSFLQVARSLLISGHLVDRRRRRR